MEKWREESGLGRNQGRTKKGQGREGREMKVPAGLSGKDGSVREGEWHGWEGERAHEVRERFPKENMRGAGVG